MRYLLVKELYFLLEKPEKHKYGFLVQKVLLLIIVLNIFSFTFPEMLDSLSENVKKFFYILDLTTTWLFVVELLLRFIASSYIEKYRGFVGKLKFLINPFTIVDILSIMPLFPFFNSHLAYLKMFRFVRMMKLLKYKGTFKQILNIDYFASSSVLNQFLILFFLSIFIIFIFSYFYHSLKTSFLIFLSPASIVYVDNVIQFLFALIELLIGLIVGSFLVSIITSTLVMITEKANKGLLSYKGKNHYIIVNYHSTLEFILKELNKYYSENAQIKKDVVLFLPNITDIEKYKADLKHYSDINIYVIYGEELNENSYKRLNIKHAEKILFLPNNEKNINKKHVRYILQNEKLKNDKLEFFIDDNGENLDYIYDAIFEGSNNKYLYFKHKKILNNLLSRVIVNNLYFAIFDELLTFDGYELYIIDFSKFFNEKLTFKEAYLRIENAILIGIVKENQVIIKPYQETLLDESYKLIVIMKDENTYSLLDDSYTSKKIAKIPSPYLKENRNICIVGNDQDIDLDEIIEFLDENSLSNLKHIVSEDGNYMKKEIWDKIRSNKDIDVIILNLDDEYEMELTFYLRSVYKNDIDFLSKIINVLKTPNIANLLYDEKFPNNIILSDKIIGEYISKVFFSMEIEKIFNELTHKYGNEIYILNKKNYPNIYNLSYYDLKSNLLENNMLYIGAFVNNKFVFDYKGSFESCENIAVLTEGIE